jgi:hypothetical protein
MTDLERARAHLRLRQRDLAAVRKASFFFNDCSHYENAVLAALSWVWEEQERIDPMDGRVFPRSVSGEYGLG